MGLGGDRSAEPALGRFQPEQWFGTGDLDDPIVLDGDSDVEVHGTEGDVGLGGGAQGVGAAEPCYREEDGVVIVE